MSERIGFMNVGYWTGVMRGTRFCAWTPSSPSNTASLSSSAAKR